MKVNVTCLVLVSSHSVNQSHTRSMHHIHCIMVSRTMCVTLMAFDYDCSMHDTCTILQPSI